LESKGPKTKAKILSKLIVQKKYLMNSLTLLMY